MPDASAPSFYHAVTPTSTYDDILLFKFLNYFSQNASERTWTARLPSLISAKNAAAMKTAARAVSLGFAAQSIRDPAMAQAACEYYGNSLRYHQASFRAAPGKTICKKKAINALPVTVLLSYFEMIQATSADAWLKHTLAAERLFVLLGPDSLNDELLNHLYFIVRSNSAIRCFLLGTKTQLLEKSWSEIPMTHPCGRGTAVFNNIVDLIIWLSNSINVTTSSSDLDLMSYDLLTLQRTMDELRRLWVVFGESIGLDTSTHPLLSECSELSSSLMPSVDETAIAILPLALRNSSAALTGAFFHAAAIMLLTLIGRKQIYPSLSQMMYGNRGVALWDPTAPNDGGYSGALRHHSSEILALTEYLRTQKIGCACLRMILPLAVVNRLSPSEHQRLMAESIFRDWSTSDGLAGLASFAFAEKESAPAKVFLAR
ncbi:hypothetical protein OHC33_000143 [Knufia fluminis]|uniref:Uncharacterized protein n=1 Tax=Knufia fluminis TaxID=191047 RepID=A0AAN8FGR5_9EURO|nr:hypothetical protein OHC33_000143 [Knufia fluminis]